MSRIAGTPIAAEHGQSIESCWRTPLWLASRIRDDVFGGRIELDPCTAPDNPVGALMFYTPADDGLKQPWLGLDTFVNPPFIDSKKWSRKAMAEVASSGQRVVFLAPAAIGTAWLHDLWEYADDGLWLRKRIRYEGICVFKIAKGEPACLLGPDDPIHSALHPQAHKYTEGSPTRGTVLFGLNCTLERLADLGTRASVAPKAQKAAA
jgi:phage N-6-adenine-methyltransferase